MITIKRLKLVTAALFALCLSVKAFAINLPKPDSWVSDFAGVMDASSKDKTTAVITELEQKTSCEIAVVTIKSLGNSDTIESAAVTLFKNWGIGKKGKDNGVLILVSVEDRKAKIEVGYGLEGILPDGLCGEILDKYMVPEFKNNNYSGGLEMGTFAVASIIAKDRGITLTGIPAVTEPAQSGQNKARTIFNIIFLVVLFIIFIRHPFLFLLFMGGGGRGGGGGGFGGGGFGGFGGGMSGGGGASRGW